VRRALALLTALIVLAPAGLPVRLLSTIRIASRAT
jgi:hypothetical protein